MTYIRVYKSHKQSLMDCELNATVYPTPTSSSRCLPAPRHPQKRGLRPHTTGQVWAAPSKSHFCLAF